MLTKNDLLVLGLLLDKPMHGYEIGQHVKSEGVTTWFDISTAAIYYSLNKLRRKGLILEARSRAAVEKSVYHVTESGRERFFAGMERSLASEEPLRHEYHLNIFLLNRLPQGRALSLLEQRWDFLSRHRERLEQALERERLSGEPLHAAILEHSVACTSVEMQWLGGIIQHLRGDTAGDEGYRGLMLLSGDLRDFHLPDLIKLIASGEHSGTLTVTDGASTRTVSFQEGRPVSATSMLPDGEVREHRRILDDVYDLFRWQEGSFTFDQRMRPQEDSSVLSMSTDDLILAGSRWVDNWSTIQKAVPSPEAVFECRDQRTCHGDLDLTETEGVVLEALDGLSDVSDVARSCGLTEFETSKVLYGLSNVGLVQPGDLGKVRLRRVFREFAELMCQSTLPYREAPDDFACEQEVNRRCASVPIRFIAGRIEDQTDPALRTQELAEAYRAFLEVQHCVVKERFGAGIAQMLLQQVRSRISPDLGGALEEHGLVAFA